MHVFSTLLTNFTQAHPKSYAVAGCLLCTGTYVGLLYVWRGMPRSHPTTIKRRMLSVTVACCVSWLPLYLVLPKGTLLLEALGLSRSGLPAAAVCPLVLTAVFFTGPLLFGAARSDVVAAATSTSAAAGQLLHHLRLGQWPEAAAVAQAPFQDAALVPWRSLVVAPVTEEFVFRSCMAPLLRLQGFSFVATVLITPMFFGAAHLHHLHDLVHYQKVPLAKAAATVAFQFSYTTVFGWLETFIFLRTRSIVAPVLVHSFCNWMGVPNVPLMVEQAGGSSTLPLVATMSGVLGFAALFNTLLDPSLYS